MDALLDAVGPTVAIAAQSLAAGFAITALQRRRTDVSGDLVLMSPTGGRDFGIDAFDPVVAWTLSVLARLPGVNMALYRGFFHREGKETAVKA